VLPLFSQRLKSISDFRKRPPGSGLEEKKGGKKGENEKQMRRNGEEETGREFG